MLRGGYGSVYVFRDVADPGIVKVGFTARLSKVRKAEVVRSAADGAALRQVYGLDMPFARTVETLLHRSLPRLYPHCPRGREWYRLDDQGIDRLVAVVESVALDVRWEAERRRRWRGTAKVWRLTQDGARRYELGKNLRSVT
jgi:hypothetical protein